MLIQSTSASRTLILITSPASSSHQLTLASWRQVCPPPANSTLLNSTIIISNIIYNQPSLLRWLASMSPFRNKPHVAQIRRLLGGRLMLKSCDVYFKNILLITASSEVCTLPWVSHCSLIALILPVIFTLPILLSFAHSCFCAKPFMHWMAFYVLMCH